MSSVSFVSFVLSSQTTNNGESNLFSESTIPLLIRKQDLLECPNRDPKSRGTVKTGVHGVY